MTDEFDVPTEDQNPQFTFTNYPVNATESVVQTVTFGPAVEEFQLLVTVDPNTGILEVLVGNGPSHEEAPTAVSEVLAGVANVIASLNDNPEYWASISKLDSPD